MKRLGRKVISKTLEHIINTKTLLKWSGEGGKNITKQFVFSPNHRNTLFHSARLLGYFHHSGPPAPPPSLRGPWADETGANLGPGRKVFSFTSTLFSFRTELPRWWQRTHWPIGRHKRCRLDPWVGNIPWRRKWQPTPVFLPGDSQEESGGQQFIALQRVGHD